MLTYEREFLKQGARTLARAAAGAGRGAAAAARFLLAQIHDPAVRRAILLGSAAYLIRRAPFLDQAAAEGVSDRALLGLAVLLSKAPGTDALRAALPAPAEPEPAPAPAEEVSP